MRECLGWLTTCDNEQSCPQNWVEYCVSELPLTVSCKVCGQNFALVEKEGLFHARANSGQPSAFPIVAPIAIEPSVVSPPYTGPDHRMPQPAPAAVPQAMIPKGTTDGRKQWLCTLANGETIRIDRDSMVIGRSRACDIVVQSAKVSRQHASVSFQGGDLWIEDLGSANGVWHNGEKVARFKVGNGDVFTISDETLLFEVR